MVIITNKISRELLIQDIRELSDIIESAHPDPYTNGGGKIAYHRRLQNIIKAIPNEGMTRNEFGRLILPFFAKIVDGHTTIRYSSLLSNDRAPDGIPLYFEPVAKSLYVSAVMVKDYKPLIGSLLVSIEGIEFDDLCKRIENNFPCENFAALLAHIAYGRLLLFSEHLKFILPEWKNHKQISVVLKHTSGELVNHNFIISKNKENHLYKNKSIIDSDKPKSSFSYEFLGPNEDIAYLRIDGTNLHKENFEYLENLGIKGWEDEAKYIYNQYFKEQFPEDINEIVEALPSSTKLFQSLFKKMKEKRTEYFLIDLRRNNGGTSVLINIFLYFLIGYNKLVNNSAKLKQVQKLSEHFSNNRKGGIDLEKISYYNQVPLTINDYNFSNDSDFIPEENIIETTKKSGQEYFKGISTFSKEFSTREFDAYYQPKKIIILCSPRTFSSGFDLMMELYWVGGKIIGINTGQSVNYYGNILEVKLTNSKIPFGISTKYFEYFPDRKSDSFGPDYPLTYDKLAYYNFDENAILLYALDLISNNEI